jgi:hypothetical protein
MEHKKDEIWAKKTILQPIGKSLNHFIFIFKDKKTAYTGYGRK